MVDEPLEFAVERLDGVGQGDANRADANGLAGDADAPVVVGAHQLEGVGLAVAGDRLRHGGELITAKIEADRIEPDASGEHHLAAYSGEVEHFEATVEIESARCAGELGRPHRLGGYLGVVGGDESPDGHLRALERAHELTHDRAELFFPHVHGRVLVAVGVEYLSGVRFEHGGQQSGGGGHCILLETPSGAAAPAATVTGSVAVNPNTSALYATA